MARATSRWTHNRRFSEWRKITEINKLNRKNLTEYLKVKQKTIRRHRKITINDIMFRLQSFCLSNISHLYPVSIWSLSSLSSQLLQTDKVLHLFLGHWKLCYQTWTSTNQKTHFFTLKISSPSRRVETNSRYSHLYEGTNTKS